MPKSDLDAIDLRILRELQAEGRLTVVELADRVGLSPSPCLRRLKRLERERHIEGYRAIISRRAVGLNLTVFVEIKVGRHSRDNAAALHAALDARPEVVACHMVSGDADFLAEVVVEDLDAYERLLTDHLLTLPMVQSIRSNFAIRPVKTNGPLAL